jgi:hypothetical protein
LAPLIGQWCVRSLAPRDPLDSPATPAAVRFKTAQGSSRGSRAHGGVEIWGHQSPQWLPWGPTPLHKPPLAWVRWREVLVATLKVAHSEIAAEKCRGEARLFAPLGCPSFPSPPKRPKGREDGKGAVINGHPTQVGS